MNPLHRHFHTLLKLALAAVLIQTPLAHAHNDSAYSHDSGIRYQRADWMASLPGSLRLKDISMVGTHDTMSFYGGDAVQTQSMPLATQLAAGVRVLDIRCRRIDNQFAIHHGFVYQHANFDDVLTGVTRFLAQHPGETVLMRVSEEYDAANSSLSFGQIFANYANKPAYSQYFWRGTDPNPTLADTRGKLVVFNNFSGNSFGLSYGNIDKQDDYNVTTNWDLYSKWSKVKNQINRANGSSAASSGFFMNYLSASGGSFPYFIVSGHSSPGTSAPRLATGLTTPGWRSSYPDFPRVNCFIGICTIAFEGTNTLAANYIANNIGKSGPGFVGIIMTDFPGQGLIDKVIALNANPRR